MTESKAEAHKLLNYRLIKSVTADTGKVGAIGGTNLVTTPLTLPR